MLRDLAPLFAYMRRYRWEYLWGTLSCVAANAIWVQFPRIIEKAIDALQEGSATRQKILGFAALLVLIVLV
jgi:ATP-binding cassette subfamily B protein